jgi:SAM-dependent methyltransferase
MKYHRNLTPQAMTERPHQPGNSNTPAFPIAFAPCPLGKEIPVWNGRAFQVGDLETKILSYEVGQSGWTDELTTFHEGTAGDDHYIDRASRLHAIDRLRRWLTSDRPAIIDVGCSSGLMLKALKQEFPGSVLLGADYIRGPLETLADSLPGVPLLQFDLTTCPLPDKSVDAVVLLNVLEHIERDEAALANVARILKPNGVAVIEVPAGPHLYDVYDKLLMHHRRYRMADLIAKIARNGLQVLDRSHLGFLLYPPFSLTKRRNRRYLNASREIQEKSVSRSIATASSQPMMHRLMALEASLRKLFYYPFGIRCLVTCRPRQ